MMKIGKRIGAAIASAALVMSATPLQAAGDLLVAPTRVVIDNGGTAQVILNNIGSEAATYRVSLEVRRMNREGKLDEVEDGNISVAEKETLSAVTFSPRRIMLQPNQPQIIRLAVRPTATMADGEYRVHMLFRAIPDAKPVSAAPTPQADGVSISLTPIYGVTIPIILRKGAVQMMAALANPRIDSTPHGQSLAFQLSRSGNASVYGDIVVSKPGVAEPVLVARGIAAYPEVSERTVSIPITPEVAAAMKGPIKIQLLKDRGSGAGTIAEVQAVLR